MADEFLAEMFELAARTRAELSKASNETLTQPTAAAEPTEPQLPASRRRCPFVRRSARMCLKLLGCGECTNKACPYAHNQADVQYVDMPCPMGDVCAYKTCPLHCNFDHAGSLAEQKHMTRNVVKLKRTADAAELADRLHQAENRLNSTSTWLRDAEDRLRDAEAQLHDAKTRLRDMAEEFRLQKMQHDIAQAQRLRKIAGVEL